MRITFFDPVNGFDPESKPYARTFNVRVNGQEITNPFVRTLVVVFALLIAPLILVVVLPLVGILIGGSLLLFGVVVIALLPLAPLLLIFGRRGNRKSVID